MQKILSMKKCIKYLYKIIGVGGRLHFCVSALVLASVSGAASAQFPAVFPLGNLNGSNGFRLDGGSSGDLLGYSANSAGDINDDGIDDLIIGAPERSNAGSVYVLFGKTSGFSSPFVADGLASPQFIDGFRVTGASNSGLGDTVAAAGDLNGDGFDDFLVGAPDSGNVYAVFGKHCTGSPCLFPTNWSSLTGTLGFRIDAYAGAERLGTAIGSAGDINDDGVSDIVLGAPWGDVLNMGMGGVLTAAGRSYIVYGRGTNDFTSPNWLGNLAPSGGFTGYRMNGTQAYGEMGHSVSGAGDINGDGIDDFIIGAYTEDSGYGNAYVLFGQTAPIGSTRSLTNLNGSNGFRLAGSAVERAGSSVSRAGDVNGDGYDDLIVGAMYASPNGNNTAGKSYVVFGHSGAFSPVITLSSLNGSDGFSIDGSSPGDTTGVIVNAAGDVNGDGYADVIIGAPYCDCSHTSSGAAYIVFGHAGSFPSSISLGSLNGSNGFSVIGDAYEDYLGSSISAVDINGDGYHDVVIGAPGADPNSNGNAGSVYVIYGHQ